MKSYHFNVGDSNPDAREPGKQVGYCARILANTPEEAVEKLNIYLAKFYSTGCKVYDDVEDPDEDRPGEGVEYLRIYFGRVSVADIDFVDDGEEVWAEPTSPEGQATP